MSADKLRSFLFADTTVMRALETVRDHGPAGAYIAAGFIRNRVWDSFYDPPPVAMKTDIDVVYFDAGDTALETEQAHEVALMTRLPALWQVRNQARMHVPADDAPYKDLADALSHWPETATAVAVRLNGEGDLDLVAPFGLDDLMDHVLRPSPAILARDSGIYGHRVRTKGWRDRWPRLSVTALPR